jgi:hypothetical protein
MRLPGLVLRVAVAIAASVSVGDGAQAQSFFHKLFGLGGVSREQTEAVRRPVPSLRSMFRYSPYGNFDHQSNWQSSAAAVEDGGFRTLCVRVCDGYYWPVSASVPRGKFYRDARLCQSSCDAEARLFYLPQPSDAIEQATDLSGRAYGRLETAFAYRKALVGGCSCRPAPWTAAEIARHKTYAAIEEMKEEAGHSAATAALAPPEIVAGRAAPDAPAGASQAVETAALDVEATEAEPLIPESEAYAAIVAGARNMQAGMPRTTRRSVVRSTMAASGRYGEFRWLIGKSQPAMARTR